MKVKEIADSGYRQIVTEKEYWIVRPDGTPLAVGHLNHLFLRDPYQTSFLIHELIEEDRG